MSQLKGAGFHVKELKDAGFTCAELTEARFMAKDLLEAGFNAVQLKDAGFNAVKLKDAGFKAVELKDAGYSASELEAAGFSVVQLKTAFTLNELKYSSTLGKGSTPLMMGRPPNGVSSVASSGGSKLWSCCFCFTYLRCRYRGAPRAPYTYKVKL